MAQASDAELYPGASPMVMEMLRDAEAKEAEFIALQTKNAADAATVSEGMAAGGVPDGKRPL